VKRQQQETLEYFRAAAAEWRQKASGAFPTKINVIKQRNDYVLNVAAALPSLERALDVGCGTGELVCDLARSGVQATGVDFAPEMIDLCEQKAQAEGITEAEFVTASIFDYRPTGITFDLISANGFIEYISEAQLVDFIDHVKTLLSPRGSLVVGSRNRLFNALSLNEFTQLELAGATYEKLIAEGMILANAKTAQEAVTALLASDDALPSIKRHPRTGGIEVETRHQYTPGQLARLLHESGLNCVGLVPVHYHAAIPRFAHEHPEAHVALAELMQTYGGDCHYLIPSASTFMVHAVMS
jgi:2-polyprenyl-3-methyl-5-hydroxy-6-metoxy-1,4-benzoquinol methylase